MLTRRLIFGAYDDPAHIEQDCANGHLFFFFPWEGVFLAGGFLPNSALAAGFCPTSFFDAGLALVSPLAFAFAATGSGCDSACFTGAASGADEGAGAACWGCS